MNGWIKAWAVVGLLTGWAYAGEPPPFRETARITLRQRLVEEPEKMALSVNTWVSVNGDWNNVNSWSLRVVPGAAHVAVFDGRSQQSLTAGLNASASALTQLLVKPTYHGNMGFAGTPFQIKLSGGVLVYRGSGQAYINPSTGGAGNVIVDVDRDVSSSGYSLILGGMGTTTKGAIEMLAVKRGRCRVLGDMSLSGDIYIVGSAAYLLCDANLGGGAPPTDPLNIIASAGYTENARPLQANKTIVVGAGSRVVQVGILPTTIRVVVIGDGKFQYNPLAATGTTPTLLVLGGMYDQTNEEYDNIWATTIIGPDGHVIGGTIRGSGIFPPSFDLREEYPGPQF